MDIPWMSRKFVKFSNIGKHPFLREIDTLADWFEFEGVHAFPVHLHLLFSPISLSLFLGTVSKTIIRSLRK